MFYVTSLTFILSGSPDPPASQATSATDERSRSGRVAARASLVAGNSKNCATSSSIIKEHCTTSLLSLSFFHVHRFLQHPMQQAPLLNGGSLLVWWFPHCTHWLVSMSIVLRHFSHFHCATSLLSLSFFQVHRVLQRRNYLHTVSVRRCALALITEHCDTSLLSLSFHQVPDQPYQKCRCRQMQVRDMFAPTS